MIRVTRRYRFSASHRLHSDRFSEAENRELFGKCNNPFGHGHDYVLDIGVLGPIEPATGLAVNVQALDGLVRESVLHDFENRNLNEDVDEFTAAVPTSENIVLAIEQRLRRRWPAVFPGEWPRLEKLRLQETRRNRFELTT
jgi:6-pyruvoyltetrahydropterin/6-carboxytetrahydropterin synthase